MKKTITSLVIFLMFLISAIGNAAYLIRLKNGGQLVTPAYWTEGQWIFFYCAGGTAGMERSEIDRIERDDTYDKTAGIGGNVTKAPPQPPQAKERAEKEELPPLSLAKEKAEKIDLQAYQDKMAKLKADINKTLTRMKKADTSNDLNAKDEATADNRRISAEMWKLTEELQEKNNGKLPADWWEGVGREEPEIQP